jgi:hypothetical protein
MKRREFITLLGGAGVPPVMLLSMPLSESAEA